MGATPQFELFEVLADGSAARRGSAETIDDAWVQLRQLARQSTNECFTIHTATRRLVAHLNVPVSEKSHMKSIFQITYAHEMAQAREEMLRLWGYRVTSAVGNENAKMELESKPHVDLFILGHAAPERERSEMVAWLREKYPKVKILALNPSHESIHSADYNVQLGGPESWLPVVAKATS